MVWSIDDDLEILLVSSWSVVVASSSLFKLKWTILGVIEIHSTNSDFCESSLAFGFLRIFGNIFKFENEDVTFFCLRCELFSSEAGGGGGGLVIVISTDSVDVVKLVLLFGSISAYKMLSVQPSNGKLIKRQCLTCIFKCHLKVCVCRVETMYLSTPWLCHERLSQILRQIDSFIVWLVSC